MSARVADPRAAGTPHRRQWRRALLAGTAGVAILALAAVVFAWWTVSTQGGARWAFERLGGALPGELQVGRMRGPIRGPLEIHGLLYRSERMEILIDRIAIHWRLRALAARRLDIRDLDAEGVHVKLFAPGAARARDTAAAELPDIDLPLDFMVKRALVRDVEITPAGGDTIHHIDEIRLADGAFRDTLTLGALTVRSRTLDMDLAGRGYTRGRYGSDMNVTWSFRPPNGEALRGTGRILGNLDTLRLVQRVTGAYQATLTGVVHHALRDPVFEGVVDFVDLPLDAFAVGLPRTRATGRLDVRGNAARFSASGDVDARVAEYGRWHAALAAERDTDAVRIARVVLSSRERPARIVARGTILTRGAARVDLAAEWRDLAWPLVGRPQAHSADGRARITGPLDGYRLVADAAVATPERDLGRWRVEGTGTASRMQLASIAGRSLGGTFTGRGQVDWRSSVAWQMALAARGVDPGHFSSGLPGRLSFDLRAQGATAAAGARGELAFDSLSGAVRNLPVWGAGVLRFTPGAWAIPDFHLGWGPNLLSVTGTVDRVWNLAFDIDAPDLSRTMPRGGGSLALDGTVSGPRARPRVVATIAADSVRWAGGQARHVAGNADLDLGRGGPLRVDLRSGPVQIAGRQFDRAAVVADGTRESHAIALTVAAEPDSLQLAAQGGLAEGGWRGRIGRLDLVSSRIGTWSQEGEAVLGASLSQATLQDFCWRSGEGRWCAEAVWRREGGWELGARLERVPLALLDPVVPPTLDLAGPMSGSVDLRGRGALLLGNARLALGPGTMTYPNGSSPIHPSTLAMTADAGGIRTDAALSFGAGDTLHAVLRTPQGAAGAQGRVLEGDFHLRMRDLAFVPAFVPDLARTSGLLTADLSLTGTTGSPRWSGAARLAGGAADVPRLAVQLREVTLDATSDAQGRLRLRGGAVSGPGRIDLAGDATVAPGGVLRADASLHGDRFLASNTDDARVLVSPDLRARLAGDSLELTGEIVVPEANVQPRPRERAAVKPSPDVVFVDTLTIEGDRRRAPIRTHSEVRLTLGRNVRVLAYGLDAHVTGSILAVDRPDLPTTGSGEFIVTRGAYRAYGRNLTIDRGRLIFAGGPLTDPALDVRASRRARDGVVAGFEVTGSLSAPNFVVFSEPAMAQRDALAYVVLGHRVERGNQSEQALVAEAASALGVTGGSVIAGKIAGQLGIDEAAIESEGGFQDASLMLGTYLSPRLYVSYGVGILDPVSTLRIQYFLSSHWTLQAETGTQSRANVLYTIER